MEAGWSKIAACDPRNAILLYKLGGVRLVSEDLRVRAEYVTILEMDSIEDPMLAVPDDIIGVWLASRPVIPPARTVAEADASHLILGPIDMKPVNGGKTGLDEGVGRSWILIRLVTDHAAVVIFEANLPPADVPAKEGDVPAIGNKRFNHVPHFLRPILVMTDAHQQLITI